MFAKASIFFLAKGESSASIVGSIVEEQFSDLLQCYLYG